MILMGLISGWANSPSDQSPSTQSESTHVSQPSFPLAVQAGYFGDCITHPGMYGGIQFTPLDHPLHQLVLAGKVGGFVHVRNQVGLFLLAEVGYRFIFRFVLFLELVGSVGIMGSFLGAECVNCVNYPRPRFVPMLQLGIGYDFTKKTNLPFQLVIQPTVFWEYPTNYNWIIHPGLQVGVIIPLSKKDN